MKLSNEQTLPVTRQQAWSSLMDAAMLQAAIPGCDSLEADGENAWRVQVTAAVGPVKARFKGQLRLEDIDAPQGYTMHFEGKGGPAGHGKGSARISLHEAGAAATLLRYEVSASVGGKIAQVGSRIVDMAAQKMAAQFFEAFDAALRARYGVAEVAVEAAVPEPGLLARVWAWLRGLFGRTTP